MSGGPLQLGSVVLGRYRLEEVLGTGAVGVVYAATDVRLERPVAVKLLGRDAHQFRDAQQRLEREARALAGLTHPNLVTVLDFDRLEDGTPAMVMERIDGLSLKKLMRSYQFPPGEVAVLLHQTLGALSTCHDRGIVHRDLKPGNLLVERDGANGLNAKVIDLGIAQMLSDDGATALTLNGEVFGSPRFMAPEQWHREPVDGRTDLYALGLIAWRMLHGEHFVTAKNPVECWREHMGKPRARLSACVAGEPVPPQLGEAVWRAMQIKPDDRFQSAAAMRAQLEPLVGGVRAHLPTNAPRWSPDDSVEVNVAATTEAVHSVECAHSEEATLAGASPFSPEELQAALDAPDRFLTSVQQSSLAPPGAEPVREARASEPVRYDGPMGTAITKGDFERALESDRAERQEVPSTQIAQVIDNDATVALEAVPVHTSAAAPTPLEPLHAEPAASDERKTMPLWMWLAGGVVLGLAAAGLSMLLR